MLWYVRTFTHTHIYIYIYTYNDMRTQWQFVGLWECHGSIAGVSRRLFSSTSMLRQWHTHIAMRRRLLFQYQIWMLHWSCAGLRARSHLQVWLRNVAGTVPFSKRSEMLICGVPCTWWRFSMCGWDLVWLSPFGSYLRARCGHSGSGCYIRYVGGI